MVSFTWFDISIILGFFLITIFIGFIPKSSNESDEYLLSGRKLGLFLFILTNVATWYGGILGIGEFTYQYGIASWFTQGFPYYVFAIIFAFLFAEKIRDASLFTIPDKVTEIFGKKLGLVAAFLVFILVSPAPYLLMVANLISLIFGYSLLTSLFIAAILSSVYLLRGGHKADILTDAFEFFIMFIGFILIVVVAFNDYGGYDFLKSNLPATHLDLTGGTSPTFIIVWFLIALWTFADPGFHQRCNAAVSGKVAKKGIIISVVFWALFDFLTTTTGLFSRAILPNIDNPVISFPLLAEEILSPGLKGLFYAAMFATILSTLNSFLFISATTLSKDFIQRFEKYNQPDKLTQHTRIGLLISVVLAIVFAYLSESVIGLWYTIGTFCIPPLLVLVVQSYFPKYRLKKKFIFVQVIISLLISIIWYQVRYVVSGNSFISEIEPMILGVISIVIVQIIGMNKIEMIKNHLYL